MRFVAVDSKFSFQVNAGIELVKREEFVSDVKQVVSATRSDYYHVLEQELHRAVRVWTQDAIQLLPSVAENNKQKKEGKSEEDMSEGEPN